MTRPLQGGRRRRHAAPPAIGALLLALAATAVVVWLALGRPGGEGGAKPPSASAQAPDAAVSPGTAPSLGAGAVALEGPDAFRMPFKQPPRGGLVFDLRSGRVLWRRNPVAAQPIASLTKVMTALLVVERTPPRARARISKRVLAYSGSGVGVLPGGKRVPVDALLHGLLLVSGNDAAIALAERVSGSERAFVALMNRRTRQLRLRCTRFSTPYGLSKSDRSCPADLAALTRMVMRRPRIARVVRKSQAAVRFPIEGGRLYLNSTNPLLRSRYRGTIGLKTGFTKRAGRSYIAVVRRGRRTLGVVLLRSPDPAAQAKQLLDRAFRTSAVR